MSITVVGVNNAAGEVAGNSSSNNASITPTMPSGAASGDRIFVLAQPTGAADTVPTNWNQLYSGGTNIRLHGFWRDYDGSWSMPAFAISSSATNRAQWLGAVALRKSNSNCTWNTPTVSGFGERGTSSTSFTASTASFTTHSNGMLLLMAGCTPGSVTATAESASQTGATFTGLTERCDGGTALGNDADGKIYTAFVTTGAANAVTLAFTASSLTTGTMVVIEQTENFVALPTSGFFGLF